MKYIFFGTPRFAKIVLEGLIDAGISPIALVCNPDRPVGRKKTITPPPTKILTIEKSADIDIMQPEKIDEVFMKRLEALEPDFFVVAAYAKILPKAILDIPRLGTLGVHPSLLPKYRGASPIQSAILSGEAETGVTIYLIDEKMDHGPIFIQETLAIPGGVPASDLPYTDLEEHLATLGSKLLVRTIPGFLEEKIKPRIQDESQATFTKKFKTEDGFVEAANLRDASAGNEKKAREILRKINALNPEPGVWTMQDGKRIKLLKAKQDGNRLVLLETQKEGERPKLI